MSNWYEKAARELDKDFEDGILDHHDYNQAMTNLRAELEEQLDWEREQRLDEYCGY